MIFLKISNMDKNITLIIASICAVLYLISGIILYQKRDESLISRKYGFRNPEDFTKLYALIEVIFSSILIIFCIWGFIVKSQFVLIISLAFVLVATLLITQIVLQKKYRVPLGNGNKNKKTVRPHDHPVEMDKKKRS